MKIIGTTQHNYIVEMDCCELERLTGSASYNSDADQRYIGRSLEIRKPWDTIRELQFAAKSLPQIANKLRALADILEPIAVEIPVIGD
jgi:hypothetical protein